MRFTALSALSAAAMALTVTAADAQSFENQVGARQGQFKMNGIAIGTLAGMARGRIAYDADLAAEAAALLVSVSQIEQSLLWPEGSSNAELMDTAALPEIWENFDDFLAKWEAFGAATLVAQSAITSGGESAIGGAIGPLLATCGACHDSYQASN